MDGGKGTKATEPSPHSFSPLYFQHNSTNAQFKQP